MPPTIPQRGGPASLKSHSGLKQRPGAVSGKTILAGAKRHRKVKIDAIRGITRPDIRRLARRGGVKRMSEAIYDTVREAMSTRLRVILRRCIVYTEYRGAKTIAVEDVLFALKGIAQPIYGFDPETYKPGKTSRKDQSGESYA